MSERKDRRLARLKLPGGQYTFNDCQVVAIIYDDAPTLEEIAARWGTTAGNVSNLRGGKVRRTATRYFRKHIRRAEKLRRKVREAAYERTVGYLKKNKGRSSMHKRDLEILEEDAKHHQEPT